MTTLYKIVYVIRKAQWVLSSELIIEVKGQEQVADRKVDLQRDQVSLQRGKYFARESQEVVPLERREGEAPKV